mmetsp:Transcript_14924/g.60882  ORF Transcript_14924/g.60882 Transcript_14924/m.60882 type:complete len:268 (-) Transcript_14924:1228-2031(-)
MYKVEKSIHCLRRDIILCYSSDDGAHNCRQMTITAPLNVVLDQEVNDTRFAANGLVRRIRPNKVSQHSEDSQFQLQICVLQAHPYQEPQGLGMGNSQALRILSVGPNQGLKCESIIREDDCQDLVQVGYAHTRKCPFQVVPQFFPIDEKRFVSMPPGNRSNRLENFRNNADPLLLLLSIFLLSEHIKQHLKDRDIPDAVKRSRACTVRASRSEYGPQTLQYNAQGREVLCLLRGCDEALEEFFLSILKKIVCSQRSLPLQTTPGFCA